MDHAQTTGKTRTGDMGQGWGRAMDHAHPAPLRDITASHMHQHAHHVKHKPWMQHKPLAFAEPMGRRQSPVDTIGVSARLGGWMTRSARPCSRTSTAASFARNGSGAMLLVLELKVVDEFMLSDLASS